MNEGDCIALEFSIKLYLQGQMEQRKRKTVRYTHPYFANVLANFPLSNYVLFNFFDSVFSYVKWGHH